MFKCIVTDYVEPDLNWEAERYQAAGIEFEALQLRKAEPSEIASHVIDADVLVVDQARITDEVIMAMKKCRLIIRHGDGYDNLDLEAATAQGIVCANKPGFWSREVAELAFCLSLALCLRLPEQQRVAASPRKGPEGGWNLSTVMPQRSISGMTIGVMGFGKIGRHAASLFSGVCSQVLVHDPLVDREQIENAGATAVGIDELLSRSDIVTIHVPATAETTGYFDHDRIARMKSGAMLVNTARGPIVRADALVTALESGHLSGAALDVTDPEPLPSGHPLFSLPNVIVTPHLGWYSEDALWNMRRSIMGDVIAAAGGALPETVINPAVLKTANLRSGEK